MEELKIRTRKVGNAMVIVLTGNFDFDMDNVTEEYIEGLLNSQSKTLVLDMKAIRKVASAFINRLVKILRTVESDKGKLYLVNVPESVLKILSMVNIIGRFHIYHSDEELKSVFGAESSASEAGEHPAPALTIVKTREGYNHVFALNGSFVEGANTSALLEEVKASLGQGARSISLDFDKTELIDTISVGLLLMLQKMCEEKKIPIKIVNPNEIVSHVLNMNEVGKLFGL